LRPPELLRARAEHQAGRLSLEELRRVEDAAIGDVARIQQEIGLEGVTDGEFRRGSWQMDFLYQIGGVAKTDQALRIQFRNEARPVEAALHLVRTEPPCTLARPACVGPFFNPVRASTGSRRVDAGSGTAWARG
jgi:methionine synthase II (cobalamin-independent)